MKTLPKILLFCIICIGVFLRLYHLDFQCLWTEELYTKSMIQLPVLSIIIKSIQSDFTPPLYYIAAHFITPRVVSAICGILTIPVMYFVGCDYKDDITGLYCAGITAILFPLVYYSQFGRSYALSILLFAITLYYYNKLEHGNHTGLGFVLFSILSIWTHLFNIIPITLMMMFSERVNIYHVLNIYVCTSPLLLILSNAVSYRTSAIANFGMTLSEMLYSTPMELFGSLYIPSTIIILYSCLNKQYTKFLLICISTITIGFLLSLFTPFFPRYFIVVDMIFILIISSVLSGITERYNKTARYAMLLCIILLFAVLQLNDYTIQYTIQKYIC